jgi:CRISPR-associated protein Cmr1
MPREVPSFPEKWQKPAYGVGTTYDIELITPLFGGVEPRINDVSFPIRPTEIRGQLQFWWRATVGARCTSTQQLREAQDRVWGSTERASPVVVRVELLQVDNPQPCAYYEKDRNNPSQYRSMPRWSPPFENTSLSYALFPFQGKLANKRTVIQVRPAECIHQARFRLIVECPRNLWPEVEVALRAWIQFGGLGSRTRRGCGALFCRDFAPEDASQLAEIWNEFLNNSYPVREWPTLAECILLDPSPKSAIQAWDAAIRLLRDFRQGVGIGRNPGQQNRPGRSRWPEPETLRRVTGARFSRHQRLQQIPDNAFPRAEFGLPIVFHFIDKDRGDPPDTVLYPAGDFERMASPLILKPLALANGEFLSLIVLLKTQPLTAVRLLQDDTPLPLPNPTLIRDPSLTQYQNSPMNGRSASGSALEAFVHFALSRGYRK